jgi:hypothetical protein
MVFLGGGEYDDVSLCVYRDVKKMAEQNKLNVKIVNFRDGCKKKVIHAFTQT